MGQLFTNNATSTVATNISSTAPAVTLAAGDGAKFPNPGAGEYFLLTLFQRVGTTEVNHEIVRCTGRNGDVLTIVRALEGTIGRPFNIGDFAELRLTAGAVLPVNGGALTTALNEAATVTIPSSSSMLVGSAAANTINITGNAAIAAFDAAPAGSIRRTSFSGSCALAHNLGALRIIGSAGMTTEPGDWCEWISVGAGAWQMMNYTRGSGDTVGRISVAHGGTGVSSLSGLVFANGTGPFTKATAAQINDTLGYAPVNAAAIGNPYGVAGLDSTGKVPAGQLPSYVDDVLEVSTYSQLPTVGETGKIYTAVDSNKIYRWGGSAYVEISASPGSTDAVPEGAGNLYFAGSRVLATILSGFAVGANAVVSAGDSILSAIGKLQAQLAFKAALTGEGTSGTWPINISGTAAYANGAASVSWTGVYNRPTNVNSFVNDFNIIARQTADFNSASYRTSGMYSAAESPANAPAAYVSLISAANGDVGLQIAGGYTADNLWFRGWYSSGATYAPWRKVWHDGNLVPRMDSYVAGTIVQRDGSGSITACNVSCQGGGNFYGGGGGLTGGAPSLTAGGASNIVAAVDKQYLWTAVQQFRGNKGGSGARLASTADYPVQAFSDDLGPAGMSFHRGGSYAVNFGLDPDNVIRLGGWSAAGNLFQWDMGGSFTALANIVAYSDERLKTNWRPVRKDFVQQWAGVKHGVYTRIDTLKEQIGLSAQAAQAIHEEFVEVQADGYLALNYGAAAAIATIQLAQLALKQAERIEAQDRVIEKLVIRMEALENP